MTDELLRRIEQITLPDNRFIVSFIAEGLSLYDRIEARTRLEAGPEVTDESVTELEDEAARVRAGTGGHAV